MKILIAADMEGISGVTNWNQVGLDQTEYSRYRKIMTEDVNAAVRGSFEAGATEVIVTDGHGSGANILMENLDPRAFLNAGNASPFAMVQGIDSADIDGVLFVGYHARSGTANGILAHTWSSKKIANVWLNGMVMGEYGINAALCGHYGVSVLMITGDQTACAQAVELLGELETVVVKHATGFSSAECVPLKKAQDMIQSAALRAVKGLINGSAPSPYIVTKPVEVKIEFRLVEMADRVCHLPGISREGGTMICITLPDMVDAYRFFRAAVSLG